MFSPQAELTVSRIAAADAAAVLERLAGTDRMERGAVFVISVEAIRERSGDRWPRKRDDVWGYLGRKLNEHLSYQDLHQRIGETDVLVAMTTEEGVAAQAVGMKVLEEVLEFFLGAAEPVDVRIRAVSRIDGTELSCIDLDPRRIATAREVKTAAPYSRQVSAEAQGERNPASFVSSTGQRLRVDFALEQIVSLRHGVTAVLRVEPTVSFAATGELIPTRKFARLSDEDILALDRATLAFGGLFAPRDVRAQPPLIVPVSFRAMGGRKGRQALVSIDGVAPDLVRQGVMVEFIDIDRGTPNGRLVEVTSLVAAVTRGVLARLTPGREAMEPVGAARFNGLTVDFSDYPLPEARLVDLMRTMALQMRGKAPALIAQGLSDFRHLQLADASGLTHAALRVPPVTAAGRAVA